MMDKEIGENSFAGIGFFNLFDEVVLIHGINCGILLMNHHPEVNHNVSFYTPQLLMNLPPMRYICL